MAGIDFDDYYADALDNATAGSDEFGESNELVTFPGHEIVEEIIERYDCLHIMPFVQRIFWLANVKEALGAIPWEVSYDELRGLVILREEDSKRTRQRMRESERESQSLRSQLMAKTRR